MAASTHTSHARNRPSRSRTSSGGQSAIALLKADHKEVSELAERFEKARPAQKKQIAAAICQALTIHTTIEEEIFYPAVREVADEELESLLNEAAVEHQSVKDLVAQIEEMLADPQDEGMFEAKVKVAAEYVKHHVREEEREMFPLVQDTELDLKALGTQLADRKEELRAH
jgi:hemerythrin superfamily protein